MTTLLFLLGIAMALALVVRYLHIPYTVALVIVGILLGGLGVYAPIRCDHDLIVDGFLPLLLFEASLQVELPELRHALPTIVALAVPGVILSALIVGALLHLTAGLPFALALLFCALIAATDPVAVVATFRELHLPKPLTMLVEGESVLNDGTALVLFSILLPAAQGRSVDFRLAALQFVTVSIGGLLIGTVAGWLGAVLVNYTDDHLVELGLTVLLAYGSYLVAEQIGVSGVIACVSAGLTFTPRSEGTISEAARDILTDVWEFAAFLANTLLFLLMGFLVSLSDLARSVQTVAWAIVATLLARAIVVYGLSVPLQLGHRPKLREHQHIVFWSGLRGALAIALALSLPDSFAQRDLFLRLTFGVVLFTLLIQGLTVRLLIQAVLRPELPASPPAGPSAP
ncbi:MAG: cation:proton antiporter [Dehalococcoidia bacterium]